MSLPQQRRLNFDLIARAYRWLEYLTFGRALERCRFYFLPDLKGCKHALIIGDGDGRFAVRLLASNPTLHADAVDSSAAMLNLLRQRCEAGASNSSSRLDCFQMDAIDFVENQDRSGCTYDLIVTHFFIDCLNPERTSDLAKTVASMVAPGAIWIVSDFRIPDGAMKLPAQILVGSLYLAFRLLCGLEAREIPDHAAALSMAGFRREKLHFSLGGLLFTERWRYGEHT